MTRAPTAYRRSRILVAALALSLIPAVPAEAAQRSDGAAFVMLAPASRSSTMSGSMEDLRRAQALRSGSEGLLYVRRGGTAYVIRDAATLRRAREIFAPQEALGAQQAELGSRQAALGSRQARLGSEQGRLGRQQADARPSLAVELGRRQEALGRQQAALGSEQDALGRQQNILGREQERLGRIAEERLHALVAEAVRSGVAQQVN